MRSIFYAYMITVLVLSACSSGKSTFERGNYYEAVITSVNRLRRNSDHKKSVETLRQAYPMAVAFYEDRAKTAIASSEKFKWSEVVKSYNTINVMHDEIKRCPGALAVIPNPVNYYSKLQEAKQNAAEENYAAGILALQAGNRENAKLAYGYFKVTNDYVPGYKEVNSYLEAALNAATVKILVEPIPVHSRSVGVSAEFFNDKISEFVHSAAISEFVRFYTRAEAQKIKLNPDHIIQLQFDEFTVGQVNKHEKEIHLTKDSVVMGTYVTAANQQTSNTPPSNTSSLVTKGTPVVTTTQSPVVTGSNTNNTGTTSNADAERAAREQAERERLERERLERERIARETAERQRAEAERIQAERLKAEREAAERAAQEAAAKAQAATDAEEKARLEKERAEKELAAKIAAEKEKAEREKAERERVEREKAERERAEKEAAEKVKAEKEKAEKEKAEKEKAEKEKAEKEKAEKEKAEKEKAEKDKAEKAKSEKAASADPSINPEDTMNVTDPVRICHIPPGNKLNARTLVINRSALKAHLAHGDSEGGCDANQDQKGKPAGNDNNKNKNDNPGKKGSSKAEVKGHEHVLLLDQRDVFVASSRTDDAASYLRYFDFPAAITEGDTNKVYGTVKATLYHFTKTTTSKGVVSFKIIDAKTGALLSAEKLPGEYVWVSEWATFNGDERALSAEQLRLTKLREQPAPAPQDLFIEFTKPIYDQITGKIREFYRNY